MGHKLTILRLCTLGFILVSIGCTSGKPEEMPTPSPRTITAPVPPAGPEVAAERAFAPWAQQHGVPYRNVTFEVTASDDTFATLRVWAEFKETKEADWTIELATVECRNVGGQWQCPTWFGFDEGTEQDWDAIVAEKALHGPAIVRDEMCKVSINVPGNWTAIVYRDAVPEWLLNELRSGFLGSPFKDAILLCKNGLGDLAEEACILMGCAPDSGDSLLERIKADASLGKEELSTERIGGVQSTVIEDQSDYGAYFAGEVHIRVWFVLDGDTLHFVSAEVPLELWKENKAEVYAVADNIRFH